MINFVTRKVIATIWMKLLNVAEQVKDGTHTQHIEAIASKPEEYEYIRRRVRAMLSDIAASET